MGLSNDLRKLISRELGRTPGSSYYLRADEEASYPYKVATVSPTVYVEGGRRDSTLTVDIYNRRSDFDRTEIEDLADEVRSCFDDKHFAEPSILAHFWVEQRQLIEDPDPALQRVRLEFLCHVYKRGDK